MTLPAVKTTEIDGLLVIDLDLRADERGWFEESWNRSKLSIHSLDRFRPVQQNISQNDRAGTLRGLHAEPWDKLVTVAIGAVFCAWVDLRPGPTLGHVSTLLLRPGTSVFIPSGVANGYQTLEDSTSYVYLVNAHWNPSAKYTAIDPFDTTLAIQWPIEKSKAILSQKDLRNPPLTLESSFGEYSGFITGAGGQLGRQLQIDFPFLEPMTKQSLDISNLRDVEGLQLGPGYVLLNAAAFTAVDLSETTEGMNLAFRSNILGVKNLSDACARVGATLVHYSTDFVFDGHKPSVHSPSDPPSPINVYGMTKAAGEVIAAANPKTYILRTSWVFGNGDNFVAKVLRAAQRGAELGVVDDQFGRPTSTARLSQATKYLLDERFPFGTYHVTCAGPLVSRYQLARYIYECAGVTSSLVVPVKSNTSRVAGLAPRPHSVDFGDQSGLFGYSRDWMEEIRDYVRVLSDHSDLQGKLGSQVQTDRTHDE